VKRDRENLDGIWRYGADLKIEKDGNLKKTETDEEVFK